MFPGAFVATTPDKPAVIAAATGESLTYRELDENSTGSPITSRHWDSGR